MKFVKHLFCEDLTEREEGFIRGMLVGLVFAGSIIVFAMILVYKDSILF